MAHTIVHFEIPADDVERAKTFYGTLFGWSFQPMGDYTIIQCGGDRAGA